MSIEKLEIFTGNIAEIFGDANILQNWYGETQAKKAILKPVKPTRIVNSFEQPGRCLFKTSSGPELVPQFFAVFGNKVFVMSRHGNIKTLVGELSTSIGKVYAIETGGMNSHVVLSDGTFLYKIDVMNPTTITKIDLPHEPNNPNGVEITPGALAYSNGRIVVQCKDTDFFMYSDLYAFTFDDLNFQKAEAYADIIEFLCVSNNLLYVFGKTSVQVYQPSSDSVTPFISSPNNAIGIGILNENSVQVLADRVFFIGSGETGAFKVYQMQGNQLEVISTPAIERQIARIFNPLTENSQSWSEDGHVFVAWSFNNSNETYVYDSATTMWHTRVYKDSLNLTKPWNLRNAKMNLKNFAWFVRGNDLVEFIEDKVPQQTNVDLDIVKRLRVEIPTGFKAIIKSIRVKCNTGYLAGRTATKQPELSLRFSRDNGKTFNNTMRKTLGNVGAYNTEVKIHNLGFYENPLLEIETIHNVAIEAIVVEFEVCNE